MILKISGLSQGSHSFDFSGNVAEIGLSDPFYGIYYLKITLEKSTNQLFLKANLRLCGKFICDRCGSDYNNDLITGFDMAYVFSKQAKFEDDVNLKVLSVDADKIDISQEIKDFSDLAVPMKNLCSEECKGLCVKCGQNFNTGTCNCITEENNPVWSPLAELKNKFKE